MFGRRVGLQKLTLETFSGVPPALHQPTCQHGKQTAIRLPDLPQAKRQPNTEYGPDRPPDTEKAAPDNTLGQLGTTSPLKEHWRRLWLTYTMVTTRNRALSTSQIDPAPSTLPPPRQPSHQASRSHHTALDPPPANQHLLQMLEHQEQLIQQQANMIEELRQPKANTVSHPERHTKESSLFLNLYPTLDPKLTRPKYQSSQPLNLNFN
ncbi:unnamed protein product [Lupinus luteus]|uniref:Uncharacterized protein n=1 Tax=Lupinus luteus TaxID=3873 RepID=A0AAV1W7W2_LUPLU